MSDQFVGEIRAFGFNFQPSGWMLCQGQLLSIAEYDVLFALIGTTYGGDGQTTFGLPDLRGRIPVHQGTSPTGQGTFVIGQVSGTETVAVQITQMPGHSHTLNAQSAAGAQPGPSNGFWAASNLDQFSTASPTTQMVATSLQPSGGSQPHDNMPPFLCINYAIALFGVFPSRS
jgi:microcystin-dependent protein